MRWTHLTALLICGTILFSLGCGGGKPPANPATPGGGTNPTATNPGGTTQNPGGGTATTPPTTPTFPAALPTGKPGACLLTFPKDDVDYDHNDPNAHHTRRAPERAMSVALSPDGRYALRGNGGGSLYYWDLATRKFLQRFDRHKGAVYGVKLCPDGLHAISGGGKTLKYWNLKTGKCVRTFTGHTKNILAINISPDGRYAVSTAIDANLKYWDIATGKCIRTIKAVDIPSDVPSYTLRCVAFTPDGKQALCPVSSRTLKLWDLRTGALVRTIPGKPKEGAPAGRCYALSISADGLFALSNRDISAMGYWNLKTGTCQPVQTDHKRVVTTAVICPDGKHGLSGGTDNHIKYWDLTTGKCLLTLKGHTAKIMAIAVSKNGKYALSGSWDNTIKLWQLP